jgi:hypothetical protein
MFTNADMAKALRLAADVLERDDVMQGFEPYEAYDILLQGNEIRVLEIEARPMPS